MADANEIVVAAPDHIVPTPTAPLTPMEILARAVERGADVDTLEKLMGLQERYEERQARKAFDEAMADAKAKIPPIKKNRRVGYDSKKAEAGRTEYSHEDFAEIARVVNPILSSHGLTYRFRTDSPSDGPVSVTCIISHRMGYSEENTLSAPRDSSGSKNNIQAVGSTVTYLQRYTLKAALGIAAENDDDGQGAGGADAQPVTDEQLLELQTLVSTTGADTAKFCRYMRVESLADITQARFQEAVSALKANAKRKPEPKKEPANA